MILLSENHCLVLVKRITDFNQQLVLTSALCIATCQQHESWQSSDTCITVPCARTHGENIFCLCCLLRMQLCVNAVAGKGFMQWELNLK